MTNTASKPLDVKAMLDALDGPFPNIANGNLRTHAPAIAREHIALTERVLNLEAVNYSVKEVARDAVTQLDEMTRERDEIRDTRRHESGTGKRHACRSQHQRQVALLE